MTVPTRFIEEDEFRELMKIEGEVIPAFKLVAIPFNPPAPGKPEPDYRDYKAIRVLLMNVAEPRLYRDPHGVIFVVLPSFDDLTFEQAQEAHPIKDGVWCYRFTPYSWDADSDIYDAAYLFPESELPAFDLDDVLTH